MDTPSPHIEHGAGFVRHAARIPRRFPDDGDLGFAYTRHAGNGVLYLPREFGRRRAVRRRQRHVDADRAIIVDADFVNQAEFIEIGRYFRVVDRLERNDDFIGQARHLVVRRSRRWRRSFRCGGCTFGFGFRIVGHAKKSCALSKACANTSTSSRVLYIANEARQLAVSPNRLSSAITQWVPARTAPPERSIIVATSCGCAPLISNATIGPLSLVVPKMRSELISRRRSWA